MTFACCPSCKSETMVCSSSLTCTNKNPKKNLFLHHTDSLNTEVTWFKPSLMLFVAVQRTSSRFSVSNIKRMTKECYAAFSSWLSCPLQNNTPAAMNIYSLDSSPGDQASSNRRAAELEPFIQEQCSEAVQSMAQQLHTQLQHLGQPAMNLQGAQLVEQALLLGGWPCPVPPNQRCHSPRVQLSVYSWVSPVWFLLTIAVTP